MQYEVSSNIATLTFEDGKTNAVGHQWTDPGIPDTSSLFGLGR